MAGVNTVTLRVEGLALARGGRSLFQALSFAAPPGALVEIKGANGSGKTSLLRVIAGFLAPSAGRIVFDGAPEPALALHYVGHQNGVKGAASVGGHIRHWAALLGGDGAGALARLGLAGAADLPARVLSQGQARRLALARLLTARRPLWLLDEPAAALDSAGRALLGELIEAHRASGGAVIAAAHEALGPQPSATIVLGPS